jgi:hypothetical protein
MTVVVSCATDLPVGLFGDTRVKPLSKKYSDFQKTQISSITSAVPSHRGALRNVINAGRDAVDADGAFDESA